MVDTSLFSLQDEQITDELFIDSRVHSRLIGARGKAISKVMERYKVDIRFPRDKSSVNVVITGLYENVEDAKEHLIVLAEDYVSGRGYRAGDGWAWLGMVLAGCG